MATDGQTRIVGAMPRKPAPPYERPDALKRVSEQVAAIKREVRAERHGRPPEPRK